MKVRPYQNKDYFDVREICSETATGVYKEKPYLARLLYCDYYVDHEPENCFVATDDEDKAIGYVLCSTDPKKHRRKTLEALQTLKKAEKGHYFEQKLALRFERIINVAYPAHLHIDIKEGYQRLGLGHELIDTLLDKLRADGVKGVHLGVSNENEKGMGFYRKYGFKPVISGFGSTIFGMKLR